MNTSLKYAIANAIFSQPEFNFSSIDGKDYGEILNIDFQRASNLSTRIRVRTKTQGTHWFTLSLKEDL